MEWKLAFYYQIVTHLSKFACVVHQGPDISLETDKDCLRSIIAQLLYRHKIAEFEIEGIYFRTHAYIPEIDSVTGQPFHEREDHNHVLKVQ